MSNGREVLLALLSSRIRAAEDALRPVVAELRPYRTAHAEALTLARRCFAARQLAIADGDEATAKRLLARINACGWNVVTREGAETLDPARDRKWPAPAIAPLAQTERHALTTLDTLRELEVAVADDTLQSADAGELLVRALGSKHVQGLVALRVTGARADSAFRHVNVARTAVLGVAEAIGAVAVENVKHDLALLDEQTDEAALLLEARWNARDADDHGEAERLRAVLEDLGVEVTDTARGQVARPTAAAFVVGGA